MIDIESTPDSGVEIKKAEVAPLLAPDFFKVTAVGITEQEHKGRGTPTKDALITEKTLFFPNHFLTASIGIK